MTSTTQVASILPPGETQYVDGNGVPLAGGSVFYYIPNTMSLKTTYQDPYGNTANSNPVILDSAGRCTVYGEGQYSMALYDSLNNLVYTALTQDLLQLFSLPATTRVALSGNANYYVATTGNDANSGIISSPWLTIQHAVNYVAQFIDLRGFTATINVADGTYTGAVVVSGPFVGQGQLQLLGDTTTPANCVISTTSADAIQVNNGGNLLVEGFKLATATSGNCLSVLHGGQVYVNGNMNFGACAGNHVQATGSGSFIEISASYTISAGALIHWLANVDASIYIHAGTGITVSGTPAFSTVFAEAYDCGVINCKSVTFSGSATGTRFNAFGNGVIDTGSNSATYLPGNAVGTLSSGGIYGTLSSSLSVINVQIFTTTGTYTPTAGMLYCDVLCVGGGGGGGGGSTSSGGCAGGGGGSAGNCRSILGASTVGTSQAVTIGAAGTAGTTGNTGGTGGTSSVGSLLTSTGGLGGTPGTPNSAGGVALGGLGGTATGGTLINANGNPGLFGFLASISSNIILGSGIGGATSIGPGGNAVNSDIAGNAGSSGAGGSGGAAGSSGAVGGAGAVTIVEYIG